MKTLPMFLNGAWVEASQGSTREILNPANNELLALAADGSERDAEKAATQKPAAKSRASREKTAEEMP